MNKSKLLSYLSRLSKFIMLLLLTKTATAATSKIEIYVSNNTAHTTFEKAYQRLTTQPQHELEKTINEILQKNHIESKTALPILGAYQNIENKELDLDNVEVLSTASLSIPQEKIFLLANTLANRLNQESILVFISDTDAPLNGAEVEFTHSQPTAEQVVQKIQKKLPNIYNQAYSLYLKSSPPNFKSAHIHKIKWIGKKIKLDLLKKVFPKEKITALKGKAFLIFKNGTRTEL